MSGDPHPDIGKWLEGHHQVSKGVHGEDVHVFATKNGSVYGKDEDGETHWSIVFHLGPLTITIDVGVDSVRKAFVVYIVGKIPLLPQFLIGSGSGSFADGITITVNLWIIKGTLKFYVKDGWLWLHYDVTVLGREFQGDIKLIPISPQD